MRPLSSLLASMVFSAFCLLGCSSAEQDGRDVVQPQDQGGTMDSSTQPDSSAVDVIETRPPISTEFPSSELLVKIIGPASNGYASSAGSLVSLTGVVFGNSESVTWSMADGTTGMATDAPFWQTDAIPLKPGDNVITVTARFGDLAASDRIMITYNPGFMFMGRLEARPQAVFVGETQPVYATVAMGMFGSSVADTIPLMQVNADGSLIKVVGNMKDDGDVTESGDEIQRDGVYTLQFDASCSGIEPIYLRVAPQVMGAGGQVYTAFSPMMTIECVNRLSPESCSNHQKTLSNARQAYNGALANGTISLARQAAVAALAADAMVVELSDAGDDNGLWVLWSDGVVGALNLGKGNERGGHSDPSEPLAPARLSAALVSSNDVPILSKKAQFLSPFHGEFTTLDEATYLATVAKGVQCPSFNVQGPFQDASASLAQFRRMSEHGIVVLATHSEAYFKNMTPAAKAARDWWHLGSQEVLWTGEAVDCGRMTTATKACSSSAACPAGSECVITSAIGGTDEWADVATGICFDATQVDLMRGRLVLGDRTYGITPSFIMRHANARPFPDAMVYLGGCRTYYNGTLAASLFGTGALGVAGYSGMVTSDFAYRQGTAFFAPMMEQQMSAGAAYGLGIEDLDNPGSYFRYFGSRNLSMSDPGILNPSFEGGDLSGWDKDGDGRVIMKLGKTGPVAGKFMSIISTGLGFTVETGSIQQSFCIPAGVSELSFFWKYYSEEFREWCGSEYQDTFQGTIVNRLGEQYHVVNLAVDDLCDKEDCNNAWDAWGSFATAAPALPTEARATCGSHYVGLAQSDVQFDQGETWLTPWQRATFDVSKLAGAGPVTLRFFCTDKGDSIYDTAVLVDHIKFE